MPRPSKKSRVAKARQSKQKSKTISEIQSENKEECEKEIIISDDDSQPNPDSIRIAYVNQVAGTFHQGAQKGINGQVVCVKANVNNTAACLPRLPTEQSLIRIKLKRRLIYKGHHICQDVNPENVRQALKWLKANNPVFEDIDINFDQFDSLLDDQLISGEHDQENDIIAEPHSPNESELATESIASDSTELYEYIDIDEEQDMHDQDEDSTDKHDESILCIAPGEGNRPQKVLEMEAQSFPAEFPDGSNTFNDDREDKLSPSRYFNARIFSADNRFARNPEYIFFALHATEVRQICDNIQIALHRGSTKTADGRKITASMLRNHEEVKGLIRRDEGYRFLVKIRGTPAYWEKSKRDVFAMIRQLGIPTFFITFSAADRRWIDIDNGILISQGKQPMTAEQHKNMTWEDHCKIIMSNPAAAARMFQQRVHTLINDVILSPANPIGKVEDYYYRTEFQQRGWPHIHMIAWVKDAPEFDTYPDEEIAEFIDKYVSCELPPEEDVELHEIVSKVQMHTKSHTRS
ncbi:uncharacterized protein [Amphiura filiformis]|uniref:uncharacterized protein n=1 Tax=Amphiura filiformis TaxID=82378 RepID=UPI003B21F4EB